VVKDGGNSTPPTRAGPKESAEKIPPGGMKKKGV